MKYLKLGRLPPETLAEFRQAINLRRVPDQPYQWIQFDQELSQLFARIFVNRDLKVQWDPYNNKPVQKAFWSDPGHGFRIHRDGRQCRSALNIAVSCNPGDWVRWYDHQLIEQLSNRFDKEVSITSHKQTGFSRDCSIKCYEYVKYTDELRNEPGDVYALDVDTFHSFKCSGPEPRIVIQTKFEGFPDFASIAESLSRSSFSNIISD